MKTVEMTKATAPLADYAREVDKEPLIVTKRGRPVAALMPIENADDETVSLSTNRRFLALIERSRQRHDTEGGISTEEMRRRLRVPLRKTKPKSRRPRSR